MHRFSNTETNPNSSVPGLISFLFKVKMKRSKQEHGKLLVHWGKRRNKYKQKGGKFYTANEMENRDYTTMTIPDAEL